MRLRGEIKAAIEASPSFHKLQDSVDSGDPTIRQHISRLSLQGRGSESGFAEKLLGLLDFSRQGSAGETMYSQAEVSADIEEIRKDVLSAVSMEEILGLDTSDAADKSRVKERIDDLRRAKVGIGIVDNTIEPLLREWSQ